MDNRYLIIADDFTGANDTGVQLRRRGFPTEVLFSGKPVCQDKSVVIDTESRTVHPDHAYEIVSHALEQVDFSQFRHIIKKIDSTMRGNIAMESGQSMRPFTQSLSSLLLPFRLWAEPLWTGFSACMVWKSAKQNFPGIQKILW